MLTSSEIIYDYAISLVGQPYLWGGDDPIYGFDCSGLVNELLKSCGMLPRAADLNSQSLLNMLKNANIYPTNVAEIGTLAFYGADENSITHVAFCLNEELCIEAGSGNSSTVTKDIAAKQNAYVRIRPIRYRTDLVSIYTPHYSWRNVQWNL